MKKIVNSLLIIFSIVIANNANAQKVAVGGASGLGLRLGSGTDVTIPIVGNVEWGFADNMSIAAHLGYEIGPGASNIGLFYFSPEFRYFMEQIFEGLYFGGYIGMGGLEKGGGYFSFGGTGGYQVTLKNGLNLDLNAQVGYGHSKTKTLTNGATVGGAQFHVRPTVAIRYVF